jgi:sugar phosphate isomerase/epimerase
VMRAGLVSVTFRGLSPAEVVRWAARAGLEGIEWGGDVHVPHGDQEAAREADALTREAGMEVAAYGSYYRLGHEEPDTFAGVLETAVALGAPILRVWPGRVGSDQADPGYRERVADDGRRIAEMAEAAGVRIACEWHGNTLTDTAESALELLEAVAHPAFRTYWQPRRQAPLEECLRDLEAALPWLVGVHVFHWDGATGARLPLNQGEGVWPVYLARAAAAGGMFALLEFVRDDDPEQMVRDAAALRQWLRGSHRGTEGTEGEV